MDEAWVWSRERLHGNRILTDTAGTYAMSGVRKITAMPLPGLPLKPLKGRKPELKWVAPTSLLVDATYQRDLSQRSLRLIRKMVEQFAWNRMKPPVVVRVNGGLHIVDGQHTAIVAATLRIAEIPVFVVEAETVDERARAFVGHNTDRVIVSPFDIYRALLASGDPDAVEVDAVCRKAKVRIRQISPGCAIAEGDTASVGLVRKLVSRRGVMRARQVLETLVKAKRAPIGQGEILAVENILCGDDRKGVDIETLARIIRIDGDAGILAAQARAKTERCPVWRALMDRWLVRINRRAAA